MVSAAAVAGLLLWSDAPMAPVLIAVIALRFPAPAFALAVLWVARGWLIAERGPTPDDEARFLEAIVTELHGGASPRAAVIRAAERDPVIDGGRAIRAALLGLDSARLAGALATAMPLNGRLAGAAWAISNESGAPLGPVAQLLADRAAERGRLLREQRGLTAQARATAWIVAGIPLLLFLGLAVTGRIAIGESLPVALVGLGLQVIGVAVVLLMLRERR